jgi:hypothetical protein
MSFYNNRVYCDVLDEMRKLYETRNFSSFLGLIEELQIYGNRMEAALEDKKDLMRINKAKTSAKKEYRALLEDIKKTIAVIDDLELPKEKRDELFEHYTTAKNNVDYS